LLPFVTWNGVVDHVYIRKENLAGYKILWEELVRVYKSEKLFALCKGGFVSLGTPATSPAPLLVVFEVDVQGGDHRAITRTNMIEKPWYLFNVVWSKAEGILPIKERCSFVRDLLTCLQEPCTRSKQQHLGNISFKIFINTSML